MALTAAALVAHVYKEAFGIELPAQRPGAKPDGQHVTLSQLEAGDLVFYNTERRPTLNGDFSRGQSFIHAPRPGKAVRVENMRGAYWVRRFDGARRISVPGNRPPSVRSPVWRVSASLQLEITGRPP